MNRVIGGWAMMQHGKTTFYISAFAVVYYLVVLYVCVLFLYIHVRCMYVGKALPFVTLSMTNLIMYNYNDMQSLFCCRNLSYLYEIDLHEIVYSCLCDSPYGLYYYIWAESPV